ncbi:hypothetical protein QBC36DRAFT_336801 [Triangularia setosa]|uniref:Uncharacterized protein n=1 Tax=Triangularia setosa TaxID=2587417 RepID=A0AAN6W138_9PEZI|nr:hypothetical protein QBC36DRAFT_336801 [Podospora setosa]
MARLKMPPRGIRDDWSEVGPDSDNNYPVESFSDADPDSEVDGGKQAKSATGSGECHPEIEKVDGLKVPSKVPTEDDSVSDFKADGGDNNNSPCRKGGESGPARKPQDDKTVMVMDGMLSHLSKLQKAVDTCEFAWRGIEPQRRRVQQVVVDCFTAFFARDLSRYALDLTSALHYMYLVLWDLRGLAHCLDILEGLSKSLHSELYTARKDYQETLVRHIDSLNERLEDWKT